MVRRVKQPWTKEEIQTIHELVVTKNYNVQNLADHFGIPKSRMASCLLRHTNGIRWMKAKGL